MRLRAIIGAAAAALPMWLSPGVAGAIETHRDGTTAAPDTLLVRGVRDVQRELDARPGFTSVLEIDAARHRITTLADVLEEVVGVRVRRYGSLGSLATASIRASDASQVEVYLDGVPLNSAQFGITNLAEVPVDQLAAIEVYRSHAPAGFGAPGLGGVINLVSADAAVRRTSVALATGSFGTRKGTLVHAGSLAGSRYLVSYGQLRSGGDFPFRYDPGTPNDASDDRRLVRSNNDFAQHSVLLKVEGHVLGTAVTLRDEWFLDEAGNAGAGNLLHEAARTTSRRHGLVLTMEPPRALDDRVGTRVSVDAAYQRSRYTNPEHEPGLPRYERTHRSRTGGARGAIDVGIDEIRQTLTFVVEAREERFRPHDANPRIGDGFERRRRSRSVLIEDALTLGGGRLEVHSAYRHRSADDNFFGPPPFGRPPSERERDHDASAGGFSSGAVLTPLGDLMLKVNRSSHERFPTLFELFGTGGEVIENPELVPERGSTWDGGVVIGHRARRRDRTFAARIEIGAFRSRRDSLIVLVQTSATSYKPLNLSRAEVEGIEVAFDVTGPLPGGLRAGVEGSFTSQNARQRSEAPFYDDRWVPYASPRELFVRSRLSRGALTLRHEYRFVDRYYRDRANRPDRKVAPHRFHAFGAMVHPLGERVTLDLEIDNATDTRIDDVYGFPVPGRTITFSASLDVG